MCMYASVYEDAIVSMYLCMQLCVQFRVCACAVNVMQKATFVSAYEFAEIKRHTLDMYNIQL